MYALANRILPGPASQVSMSSAWRVVVFEYTGWRGWFGSVVNGPTGEWLVSV